MEHDGNKLGDSAKFSRRLQVSRARPANQAKRSGPVTRYQAFLRELPSRLDLALGDDGRAYSLEQTDVYHSAVAVGSKQLNDIIRAWAERERVRPWEKAKMRKINAALLAHARRTGVTVRFSTVKFKTVIKTTESRADVKDGQVTFTTIGESVTETPATAYCVDVSRPPLTINVLVESDSASRQSAPVTIKALKTAADPSGDA